tara:strand:- start:3672 stop:4583 length:912 start_codon:yes stop_codon:yes gene_type:complete
MSNKSPILSKGFFAAQVKRLQTRPQATTKDPFFAATGRGPLRKNNANTQRSREDAKEASSKAKSIKERENLINQYVERTKAQAQSRANAQAQRQQAQSRANAQAQAQRQQAKEQRQRQQAQAKEQRQRQHAQRQWQQAQAKEQRQLQHAQRQQAQAQAKEQRQQVQAQQAQEQRQWQQVQAQRAQAQERTRQNQSRAKVQADVAGRFSRNEELPFMSEQSDSQEATQGTYAQQPQRKETCWSETVVPMIALYTLICSLLFVTGTLDPRKGLGQIILITNLVLLCMIAGVVMMRPTWIFVGGCD